MKLSERQFDQITTMSYLKICPIAYLEDLPKQAKKFAKTKMAKGF